MKLSDFDFDLPDALIAKRPARPRSASRMLVASPDQIVDAHSLDLPNFLKAGDRLVLNDTRVIPARLSGRRHRGDAVASIDATLLEPTADGMWQALLKPLRKVHEGETLVFSEQLNAVMVAKNDGQATLKFNRTGASFEAALQACGAMPLPPYIAAKRAADRQDFNDYQSVWAREPGAVAAPTASLHFDNELLGKLRKMGVDVSFVTLHVGAGTFLPVKVDDVSQHKMHAERGQITAISADEINKSRANGGRIVPVGTTALRLLETAADQDGNAQPWQGATDIFIRPGYRFKIADALVTNFHLPKSTLMMLVSAFMGKDRITDVYRHAISQQYRFFSYGDASLLLPHAKSRLR